MPLKGYKFTWKVSWSMGWDGMLLNPTEGIFQLLAGTSKYDLFILNDKSSRKKNQNAWTAESFIPAHWLLWVCAYVTNIPTLLLLLDLGGLKKICKPLLCKSPNSLQKSYRKGKRRLLLLQRRGEVPVIANAYSKRQHHCEMLLTKVIHLRRTKRRDRALSWSSKLCSVRN